MSREWNLNTSLSLCAILSCAVIGCGQSTPKSLPTSESAKSVHASADKFLLASRPADAKPVGDVRDTAEDGSEVTILGRIGGGDNPWVEGRAAFTIVDPKIEPCDPSEGCPTPWDYCCKTDLLPANRALIKVVDDAGESVEEDARKLLGVKELQTLIVKGRAKRDDAGNLTVLAKGIYVVPEDK